MATKTVRMLDPRDLTLSDREQVAAAADRLRSEGELPAEVRSFIAGLLGRLADGRSVAAVDRDELLTSNEAADLIGVSRPLLNQLLDEGRLPFHTTQGGHRRIRVANVLAYIEERDALAVQLAAARARRASVGARVADELGLSKERAEALGIN